MVVLVVGHRLMEGFSDIFGEQSIHPVGHGAQNNLGDRSGLRSPGAVAAGVGLRDGHLSHRRSELGLA